MLQKIETIKIPTDKIGELIGPGGKNIRSLIAQTGATIDVEDDGIVTISSTSDEAVQNARSRVESLTREVQVNEIFEGEVKRILPFGAFVELLPGKEGMVHVSHMAEGYVKNPSDIVSIGEKVKVKVIEIDDQGRINLSMRLSEEPGSGRRESGPQRENSSPREMRERPERSAHPLSMQFRREREQELRKKGPRKRFRKPY